MLLLISNSLETFSACNTPAGQTDYMIEEISIDDHEDYNESLVGDILSAVAAYFDFEVSLGEHHWQETKQYICTEELDKGYGLYHRKYDRYTDKSNTEYSYAIKSLGTSLVSSVVDGVGENVKDGDADTFSKMISEWIGDVTAELEAGTLSVTPSWDWKHEKFIREIEGCPTWNEFQYGNKSVLANFTGFTATFEDELFDYLPSIKLELLRLGANYSYKGSRADAVNTFTHSTRVLFYVYRFYYDGKLTDYEKAVDTDLDPTTTKETLCW